MTDIDYQYHHVCGWCDEVGATVLSPLVYRGDDGNPHSRPQWFHRECMLRQVMGGIGHLIAHRYWCIERSDPDAGLTMRQSALLVWHYCKIVPPGGPDAEIEESQRCEGEKDSEGVGGAG